MSQILNRIGETRLANNGQKMTIIKYVNKSDVDIQFEDGTIVYHRWYKEFKKGSIKNPNFHVGKKEHLSRIGEKSINSQGLEMEIIEYKSSHGCTIKFIEDNTIISDKYYVDFKRGKIKNPNFRVGEESISVYGQKMKIVKYNNSDDIEVEFEDGTVVKHKNYTKFKNGNIKNPNFYSSSIVGTKSVANNGLKMEIIACRNYLDIDIKFEDGTIVYNRTLINFKKGCINHPLFNTLREKTKRMRIDETSTANNGLKIKLINYYDNDHCDVEFEDGVIVNNIAYRDFKSGVVKHPTINAIISKKRNQYLYNKNISAKGQLIEIINYNGANDIDIRFEDGYILKHVTTGQFKIGNVVNPNYKSKNIRSKKICDKKYFIINENAENNYILTIEELIEAKLKGEFIYA